MSYGVMAYSVKPTLWAAIGSGALMGAYAGAEEAAVAIDELLAGRFDGGPSPSPVALDLLGDLIHGRPYDQRAGFAYGYWLKHICEVYGRPLVNNAWMPIRAAYIKLVEVALADAGVPERDLSLDAMLFGDAPVPLPRIDDFPGIGVISADRVPTALRALEAADLAAVTDPDVRESIEELRTWMSTCAARGDDLVCFYH